MTDFIPRFSRALGLGLALGLAALPAVGISGSLGAPPAPSCPPEASVQADLMDGTGGRDPPRARARGGRAGTPAGGVGGAGGGGAVWPAVAGPGSVGGRGPPAVAGPAPFVRSAGLGPVPVAGNSRARPVATVAWAVPCVSRGRRHRLAGGAHWWVNGRWPGLAHEGGGSNSVVKIFATLRYPDVSKPWAKEAPQEISGSGMVIEGKRILTNAHMVLYASEIQVQANGSGDRISATVEAVAKGIDLAVLKLEDESFFATHAALQRASKLPKVKDSVLVYGYPTGGTSLSITKGIVSRIEYTYYNFPVSGLRIQIDAAINHGNSGGPAMVGDKVVGLAFSFLGGAQNIGYIIPSEEIDLMLGGVNAGGYKGKLASFDGLQTLENPALRRFLALDSTIHGIVVARPDSDDPSYPLKRWDVITQIGDAAVDDQGMIRLGDDLRVQFSYLTPRLARDGTVPLRVERAGKSVAVDLPVKTDYPALFPDLKGAYPSYFIFGPLVFTSATQELLAYVDSSKGLVPHSRASGPARSPPAARRSRPLTARGSSASRRRSSLAGSRWATATRSTARSRPSTGHRSATWSTWCRCCAPPRTEYISIIEFADAGASRSSSSPART